MELVRIGKKGQLTIPKSILKATGIDQDAQLLVETTEDGAIILRQAAVYPIERYTGKRLAEFEETNSVPASVERRAEAFLRKAKSKKR